MSDPVETSNGWVTNGWMFTTGLQDNDWTSDLYVPYAKGRQQWYTTPTLIPVAGQGSVGSTWLSTQFLKSGKVFGRAVPCTIADIKRAMTAQNIPCRGEEQA